MIHDPTFPPDEPSGDLSVSVVIPTHQRPLKLTNALRSVLSQTYKPNDVIVVATEDEETKQVVSFFDNLSHINIDWVLQNPKGTGYARQKGLEISDSDIVVFTDDDDVHPKNWLSSIMWTFKSYDDVVTAGGNQYPHHSVESKLAARVDIESGKKHKPSGDFKIGGKELRTFTGGNIAYRRSAAIGVNWEQVRGREVERPHQIKILEQSGGKNAYIPVPVWHVKDYSFAGMIKGRWKNGRSAYHRQGSRGRSLFGSVLGILGFPALLIKSIYTSSDPIVGFGLWVRDQAARWGMVYEHFLGGDIK